MRRRRAGEIAFVNKRNESITLHSKSLLYIFGKFIEKGYIYSKTLSIRTWVLRTC